MVQTSLIAKFVEQLLESADDIKKGVKNKLEPIKDGSDILFMITMALAAFLYALKKFIDNLMSSEEGSPIGDVAEDGSSTNLTEGSYGDIALGHKATVVSKFGSDRSWNRTPAQRARGNNKHMGTDYRAAYGTPLYAPFNGTVIYVKKENTGASGRYVKFQSDDGITTVSYMHLSSLSVNKGDKVKQGQFIGKSGASGHGQDRRYSPHLHLEVKKNGVYVNPESLQKVRIANPISSSYLNNIDKPIALSKSQIKTLSTIGVSDSKIKEVFKYLSARLNNSMSAAGLSGLLGNLIAESGLNPRSHNRRNGNYGAQGIAQWRGPRVEYFVKKFGKYPKDSSLIAQLDFVVIELQSTHKTAYYKLARASSPESAADDALGYYEFPSGFAKACRSLGKDARVSVRRGSARRVYNLCKDLIGVRKVATASSTSVNTHSKHVTK